ncbi:hypothetical protein C8J55DRAFT_487580 [Lentinula edodes]|uniref:Uncharacterized protein n=1 Tax=Lentinula lateritia TaxID=40482 RepID=A0A9W9AP76_9AGAR|nr:hypothetical protein C8J55DRAFT_487580 [Lentinula edodes]
MSVTARGLWYNYEYHRGMYTNFLECFKCQPRDPNVAYELHCRFNGNRGLSHKFTLEQESPVVLFEEGDGEMESRVMIYFGGYQFFSFATLIRAVTFLYEFWHSEPIRDHCDGVDFGTRWMRDNLIQEYRWGSDHRDGIEWGWNWLANV